MTKEELVAEFQTLGAIDGQIDPAKFCEAFAEVVWPFLDAQQRQADALESIAKSLQEIANPPVSVSLGDFNDE